MVNELRACKIPNGRSAFELYRIINSIYRSPLMFSFTIFRFSAPPRASVFPVSRNVCLHRVKWKYVFFPENSFNKSDDTTLSFTFCRLKYRKRNLSNIPFNLLITIKRNALTRRILLSWLRAQTQNIIHDDCFSIVSIVSIFNSCAPYVRLCAVAQDKFRYSIHFDCNER